jgi:hypothetical protein
LAELLHSQVAEVTDCADKLIFINRAAFLEISLGKEGTVYLLIDLIGLDEDFLLQHLFFRERIELFFQVCQLPFVEALIERTRALAQNFVSHV